MKAPIFRKMRQFSFFLNVQATFRLCNTRVYSSLTSNSNSWHAVAKAVPKTYASQAQKLARSLEEQFNIGEDGTVITARNGVKSNVRAEDLMSFYVTKKKTKLTAANLTDILEEMKTLRVSPLHAHSKKIYEEARKISSAGIERINASSSTATAQADKAEEIIEPLKPTIAVAESLTEVVEEREKPSTRSKEEERNLWKREAEGDKLSTRRKEGEGEERLNMTVTGAEPSSPSREAARGDLNHDHPF